MHSACSAFRETPPRAWGRLNALPPARKLLRNTPTSVGKTWSTAPRSLQPWKHPHERGEDYVSSQYDEPGGETPPRAWGRRIDFNGSTVAGRNTPTSVGKTPGRTLLERVRWKHPHERGEDWRDMVQAHLLVETPPRAWGRQMRSKARLGNYRNTPTSVGKTTGRPLSMSPE